MQPLERQTRLSPGSERCMVAAGTRGRSVCARFSRRFPAPEGRQLDDRSRACVRCRQARWLRQQERSAQVPRRRPGSRPEEADRFQAMQSPDGPPPPRPAQQNGSGHVAPVAQQLLLDELQPRVILGAHLEAFERGDLVEVEQQVAAERVGDAALDEGDRDQPLALGDRLDLVERVGWIDDRLAGAELEPKVGVAKPDVQRATLITLRDR